MQAKEKLERKRRARQDEDQRMRKPWQQPPPPKKDILRAKQKQKPVSYSWEEGWHHTSHTQSW